MELVSLIFKNWMHFICRLYFLCAAGKTFHSSRFLFFATVIVSLMWKENFHTVSIFIFLIYWITSFYNLFTLSGGEKNWRGSKFVSKSLRNASCRKHYVSLHCTHLFIWIFIVCGLYLSVSHSRFLRILFSKHVIFA